MDAYVTVNLLPRPIPVHWLMAIFRKQKETLTLEANLDCAPGFQLEIHRHQWLTRKVELTDLQLDDLSTWSHRTDNQDEMGKRLDPVGPGCRPPVIA